jgi:hypothetical protein
LDKIFTLAEANQLIPHLEEYLAAVQQGKAVLLKTRTAIRKASSKAQYGGGSPAGLVYVRALEDINRNLHAIHEMGVHVKDLDMGLCDFPYVMDGRVVYLCWKLGETEVKWWHEINSGYNNRKPLDDKDL